MGEINDTLSNETIEGTEQFEMWTLKDQIKLSILIVQFPQETKAVNLWILLICLANEQSDTLLTISFRIHLFLSLQ